MSRWAPKLLCIALLGGLTSGCPAPHPIPPKAPAAAAPRAALKAFLADQKAGHFEKAYALLAAPLRARYTPARLASDYHRDKLLAAEKLARIRAALSAGTPLQVHEDQARLPLGTGRAVHLVEENGAWHLASLE